MSRRSAALGVVLTPLVLGTTTGCAGGPLDRPAAGAASSSAADLELVREALGDELSLAELCRSAGRRHERLMQPLGRPVRAHQDHEELLMGALDGRVPEVIAQTVPRDLQRALAAVVAAEREVSRAHVRRAVAAASGPLARVLAAMAAAAAQHGEVLATSAVLRDRRADGDDPGRRGGQR